MPRPCAEASALWRSEIALFVGRESATLAGMKRRPAFLLAFAAWFAATLLPAVLPAQDNAMKTGAPAVPVHFVRPDAFDAVKILPPPPAAGSLAAGADLAAVRQAQVWRTPEQIEWARQVEKFDVFAVFGAGNLLGPQFQRENFPLLGELFRNLDDDLRPLLDSAKNLFARPRPFLVDPRLEPCVSRPTTGSYPSRHACDSYLSAAVLAEIFPGKRAELLERAERAAWGRVLGGVHFPSDLEGGRRLAEAGVAELRKSAAFRAALEWCRAEAAAVAGRKAA